MNTKYMKATTVARLKARVNKVNDLYFKKETIRFFRSSIAKVYSNKAETIFLVREKTIAPGDEVVFFNKIIYVLPNKAEFITLEEDFNDIKDALNSFGNREKKIFDNLTHYEASWNSIRKDWVYMFNHTVAITHGDLKRFIAG